MIDRKDDQEADTGNGHGDHDRPRSACDLDGRLEDDPGNGHGDHDDRATEESIEEHNAGRPPTMRLFVRRLPGARRPLELLRLDSWGDTLLGTKLRGELATGYAILLAVCVFEVCAWTLLFNYIFQGAEFAISGWTCAAVALGVLWGIGIFTIDKNLITSDLLRPGWRKWAGVVARIALVAGSAYLTAEPIEQLVFRPMIEDRLKEETIREQAVAYVERLHELKARQTAVDTKKPENDEVSKRHCKEVDEQRNAVKDLQAKRTEADVAVEQADLAKQRADRWVESARRAWDQARQEDPLSTASSNAEQHLLRARSAASEASRALDHARAVSKAARQELDDGIATRKDVSVECDKALTDAEKKNKQEKAQLRGEKAQYRIFIEKLRDATYGGRVEREDGREVKWKAAGAIERAIVLGKLRDGDPPRWPEKRFEILMEAANQFGLADDFSPSSSSDRGGAFGLWLLVRLVAAAFPLLSVFYKFTTSHELKMYYSVDDQAGAGNPDAVVLQRAQRLRAAREATRQAPRSSVARY